MAGRRNLWLRGWLLATLTAGVCLGQIFPALPQAPEPKQPLLPGSAWVVQMHGDVSVLRGSEPWALNIGDAIRPQQVILTGEDSFAVLELEDGSTFQVFPDSRVTFRANQGDWRDMLDLWLGRVKIFIHRLGGQPNRNRVYTPTAVISVRGTVFDVMIEDEDDTTLVSVDEGLVEVRHRLIGESKSKLIEGGQYIRVYKNAPIARSRVDKNDLARRIFQAATDALYTVMIQNPTGSPGGGTTTTGGGGPQLPGDTGGTPTPPSETGGGSTSAPVPPAPTTPPVPPPPGG